MTHEEKSVTVVPQPVRYQPDPSVPSSPPWADWRFSAPSDPVHSPNCC